MNPSSFRTQRGVALVVSMVMLVAITLIGVFVMSGSHLEWLMSNNSRFQADAEMRAEAALRDGENDAYNNISDPSTYNWGDGGDAYYSSDPASPDIPADPRNIANWDTHAFNTRPATTISSVDYPAEYLVEYMGCDNPSGGGCGACHDYSASCIYTYRIWAHAADSKGASCIVQSTFTNTIQQPPPPGRNASPGPPTPNPSRVGFAEINHD